MRVFFATAASLLAKNLVPFNFSGSYISCALFDISPDANDKSRVWYNEGDFWLSFTDLGAFKFCLNQKIANHLIENKDGLKSFL